MSSVLTGQSGLRARIVQAAEGPVICLLLFAVAFLLPGPGDGARGYASPHILLFAGGAFAAFAAFFSALFWLLIQHEEDPDHRLVLLASALLGMGLIDGVCAGYNGATFSVPHGPALLVGGMTLALIGLPRRMLPRRLLRYVPRLIGSICLAVGILLLLFSGTVPAQEMSRSLRSIARPLVLAGGISFLLAWLVFLRIRNGEAPGQTRLPANGSFLFALASLLSLFSSHRDLLWWFRDLLLFFAYLLCSFFLLISCRDAIKKLRKNHEELEATKKRLSEVLRHSQPQLERKVLENTGEAVVITDADASIVEINRAFTRITGYEPKEIIGKNPRISKSGHHDPAFYEAMWKELLETGKWSGEIRDRRKTGEVYQKRLTIHAIYDNDGHVVNYVGMFTDITEKRETERQLKKLLFYDPLTSLPNRTLFEELLPQALLNSQFHDEPLVLLCIDLYRFKDVNDVLGYKAGDDLLIQVSKRIRSSVRETDTVSRLCGDKFMVLLFEVKLKDCVGHLVRHVLHVLQQPFHIADEEVFVDACIGISVYPEDGRDTESLVRNADTAMNYAKKKGQGKYRYFRAQMNEHLVHRVTVERELRHALEHQEFIHYYQPKYNLSTGKMVGTEALMRWQHPIKGIISPAEFIPVAEESSLILAVGEWGIREACRQVRAWQDQGLGILPVAVNLSSKQFQDKQLLRLFIETLDQHGIKPEALELEITESVLMENPDEAAQLLADTRELGVRIAIDDFGTGYSSLAYLKRFPVNTLKIDQVFITDIVHDRNDAAIVTSILSMAESLHLKVVAEGVETKEQLELLKKMGCEEVQGYYFSKPLPPEGIAELLTLGNVTK